MPACSLSFSALCPSQCLHTALLAVDSLACVLVNSTSAATWDGFSYNPAMLSLGVCSHSYSSQLVQCHSMLQRFVLVGSVAPVKAASVFLLATCLPLLLWHYAAVGRSVHIMQHTCCKAFLLQCWQATCAAQLLYGQNIATPPSFMQVLCLLLVKAPLLSLLCPGWQGFSLARAD